MTEEAHNTRSIAEVWGGFFAWIAVRLFLVVFGFFPFVLGSFVGGVGLHDPDTCWLLSLGRYIFEHHALPATDPFSYTFALQPGKPFVMYQWLTELIFYCAYKIGGLSSLLMLTALILGQSFLVIPVRLAARFTPVSIAALLAIIGVCASCFHYLARPEIASYICMSIGLLLMRRIYLAKNDEPVQWRVVWASAVLFLVWANAHSAFVLGLILQFAALVVTQIQAIFEKKPFNGSSKTAAWALLASTSVTFCNPYGFGLWAYLPGLFFAKFNYRIAELRPIRFTDLNDFTYYPFVLLVLVCLIVFIRAILVSKKTGQSFRWSNLAVILICVYYGFAARRIIPFSVLMMISQVSELWIKKPKAQEAHESLEAPEWSETPESPEASDAPESHFVIVTKRSFATEFEKQFAALFNPFSPVYPLFVAVMCIVGCLFTFTKVISPTIPQQSTAFAPPIAAIDFLRKNRPSGNVLNDAQFGDMLIWYAPEVPVFIDTRYDMHGEQMALDYVSMMSATDNWRELIDRYKIDWVFLPSKTAVLKELTSDANWVRVFGDDTAVVLRKRKTTESHGVPPSD